MLSLKMKTSILCLSVFFLNGANAQVIFQDDFNDGNANGWNETRGTWIVASGEYIGYQQAPDNDLYTKTGESNWSNYTFEAQMKFVPATPDDWNDFGLLFYDQGTEYIRFTLGNADGPPTARISYDKYDGQEYNTAAELATIVSEPTMISDTWYNVRLSIYNDCVYAYVNDVLVAYADNLPFTHGNIGLVADDPTVYFDNIVVASNTPVAAEVDIVPDTIRTNTKQLACNIWPPEGYSVEQIDTDSIRLSAGAYPIHPRQAATRSKQQKVTAKFATSELSLISGDTLDLTISGMLIDGTPFADSDSVVVVEKGGKPH